MQLNVGKEIAAMEQMAVGQLRNRYAEVFGETRCGASLLWKRTSRTGSGQAGQAPPHVHPAAWAIRLGRKFGSNSGLFVRIYQRNRLYRGVNLGVWVNSYC